MWTFLQSALCGRRHLSEGTSCQDQIECLWENEVYAVALADGAGSASHAEEGARAAVSAAARYLTGHFDEMIDNPDGTTVKRTLVAHLQQAAAQRADALGAAPEELASTILAAAVKGPRFLLLHLGDGVIGYAKNGKVRLASAPDNGEFSSSTHFVTSPHAVNHLRLYRGTTEQIGGFVLMSDGTAESFYQRKTQELSPALQTILQNVTLLSDEQMTSMLHDDMKDLVLPRTQDDCSIVFLVRQPEGENGYWGLGLKDKVRLLGLYCLPERQLRRVVRGYDRILDHVLHPKSLNAIARATYCKPKYAFKKIRRLQGIGLLQYHNGKYQLTK